MNINFKGYGENVATFMCDSTVEPGKFVVMKSNYEVTKAKKYNELFGYCLDVKDGYAAVQLSGYVEVQTEGSISVGTMPLTIGPAGEGAWYYHAADNRYKVIYAEAGKIGLIL